jgi:hypothetical protein
MTVEAKKIRPMNKQTILEILHSMGVDPNLILPTIFGTLVSMIKSKKQKFIKSLGSFLAGWLSAVYVSPLIIMYVDLGPKSYASISFICGYYGLILFNVIYKVASWIYQHNHKQP